MFTTLLKYDLKSIGRWYIALNAGILISSFALGLSLRSFESFAQTTSSSPNHVMQLIPLILAMIFGILVAGSWVATVIIIVRRFYQSIFGKEGYLTLTLPVTTHQIILSRLLAAFIWTLCNTLVLIIGVGLLILPMSGVGQFLIALPHIVSLLTISKWEILLVYLIAATISEILMFYLAITIGQLFTNRRILMSFVAYFAIAIIGTVLSSIIDSHLLKNIVDISYFGYATIGEIIDILIFYFITYYLLENKVDIYISKSLLTGIASPVYNDFILIHKTVIKE